MVNNELGADRGHEPLQNRRRRSQERNKRKKAEFEWMTYDPRPRQEWRRNICTRGRRACEEFAAVIVASFDSSWQLGTMTTTPSRDPKRKRDPKRGGHILGIPRPHSTGSNPLRLQQQQQRRWRQATSPPAFNYRFLIQLQTEEEFQSHAHAN